jgi:hypothetical protein
VVVLVAEVVVVLAAEDQAVVAEEENTSIWYIRLEGCLIIQTAFFLFILNINQLSVILFRKT